VFASFDQTWRFAVGVLALISLSEVLPAQTPVADDEVSLHAAPYLPPPMAAVIRTRVELVEVPAVVRDSKGVALPGLKREDFEIFDAGKRQEISAFSVETFPPVGASVEPVTSPAPSLAATPPPKSESPRRYIALVFDDLNSDVASLSRGKIGAEKFVSEALAPRDLVGIFTTAQSQIIEFTADVRKLSQAIDAVKPHPRYSDELQECAPLRAYEAYLIDSHLDNELLQAKAAEFAGCSRIPRDAAVRAIEAKARLIWGNAGLITKDTLSSLTSVVSSIAKMPGQRLVLLASAGFLSGGQEGELQDLSTAALHNGVIISSLELRGLYTVIPGGDARTPPRAGGMRPAEIRVQTLVEDVPDDALAILSSATGGQFFHNNDDLARGFRRLGALPEVMYVLGFAPADVVHDGKYHPLKVRLTSGQRGSVDARIGYFAPPKDAQVQEALAADRLRSPDRDHLLMSADSPSNVAARITAEPATSDSGPRVVAKAWIDISRLNFETKNERRTQKLIVIAALLDGAGNFVVGRQAVADLALKAPSFEELSATGLTVSLSLHAPLGAYNLRVLIQEALTGKITAASSHIELR